MCDHINTILIASGGVHYSGGEVWDDIEQELYCLDCRETVPEKKPQPTTETVDDLPI